jgi:hypothetical protein
MYMMILAPSPEEVSRTLASQILEIKCARLAPVAILDISERGVRDLGELEEKIRMFQGRPDDRLGVVPIDVPREAGRVPGESVFAVFAEEATLASFAPPQFPPPLAAELAKHVIGPRRQPKQVCERGLPAPRPKRDGSPFRSHIPTIVSPKKAGFFRG